MSSVPRPAIETRTETRASVDSTDEQNGEVPPIPQMRGVPDSSVVPRSEPSSGWVQRFRQWMDLESPNPDAVKVSPWAFLRAMFAIAVSIRHPFSTTVIDLSTGKAVREV